MEKGNVYEGRPVQGLIGLCQGLDRCEVSERKKKDRRLKGRKGGK